ncbi:MAG TPA: hypothetical protein ACFYD1_00585 [Candidatus Hypogeohydataceae bacterium YC38]
MELKIHSISTEPARPVAGELFKLVIEGENFGEKPHRLLYFEKPYRDILSKGFIHRTMSVFVDIVRHVERGERRVVSKELIAEPGIYYVSVRRAKGNPVTYSFDPSDFPITVERPSAREGVAVEDKTPPHAETPPFYQWEVDKEKHEVKCNDRGPVKLEPRLFELFRYLHGRKNIKTTMESIKTEGVKIEKRYKHLVVNRINKLISSLNKKAGVLGLKDGEIKNIIERHKKDKKLKAVTFHAK